MLVSKYWRELTGENHFHNFSPVRQRSMGTVVHQILAPTLQRFSPCRGRRGGSTSHESEVQKSLEGRKKVVKRQVSSDGTPFQKLQVPTIFWSCWLLTRQHFRFRETPYKRKTVLSIWRQRKSTYHTSTQIKNS
jgi:hypothetical protein